MRQRVSAVSGSGLQTFAAQEYCGVVALFLFCFGISALGAASGSGATWDYYCGNQTWLSEFLCHVLVRCYYCVPKFGNGMCTN